MVYLTGDSGSIPGRADRRKIVRVSDVNFYLPSPTLKARYGGIIKELVGACDSCVFTLFPVEHSRAGGSPALDMQIN